MVPDPTSLRFSVSSVATCFDPWRYDTLRNEQQTIIVAFFSPVHGCAIFWQRVASDLSGGCFSLYFCCSSADCAFTDISVTLCRFFLAPRRGRRCPACNATQVAVLCDEPTRWLFMGWPRVQVSYMTDRPTDRPTDQRQRQRRRRRRRRRRRQQHGTRHSSSAWRWDAPPCAGRRMDPRTCRMKILTERGYSSSPQMRGRLFALSPRNLVLLLNTTQILNRLRQVLLRRRPTSF